MDSKVWFPRSGVLLGPLVLLGAFMLLAGTAQPGLSKAQSEDEYLGYTGIALARHSTKFLYGESHVLHYRDGRLAERVVLYTCRDGSPFARKVATYVDALAPDFLLEDASNGLREGVASTGGERTVFFRGGDAAAQKGGKLPEVPGLVADAGFDEFIRSHWRPLMEGKSLPLPFLVPSRLDDVTFAVRHVGSATVGGTSAEVFRLTLSGVLGWVAPAIDVSYGADDHVLMRYEGLSDLRDASGGNLSTQITFPERDRTPSDAQSLSTALQARLARCK